MKAAFIVNARNKAKYAARAVRAALEQTYPCHILLSDQSSEDGTYEAMEKALAETPMPMERYASAPDFDPILLDREVKEVPRHKVELLRCPVDGKYGMAAANAHTLWLAEQTDAPWIFQCSADDWSLPERVATCMQKLAELERKGKSCSAIACSMYYLHAEHEFDPATTPYLRLAEDMYVAPGWGLTNLMYGSTIQGWSREFLLKAGTAGDVTGDVFHGYLAACDKGYYVVAKPLHVKVEYADLKNMGFQGKMKAAEQSGDKATINRINELNRFQLFELYLKTAERQQQLYPLVHESDRAPLINMLLSQACGWYSERKRLHQEGLTPWIL